MVFQSRFYGLTEQNLLEPNVYSDKNQLEKGQPSGIRPDMYIIFAL